MGNQNMDQTFMQVVNTEGTNEGNDIKMTSKDVFNKQLSKTTSMLDDQNHILKKHGPVKEGAFKAIQEVKSEDETFTANDNTKETNNSKKMEFLSNNE